MTFSEGILRTVVSTVASTAIEDSFDTVRGTFFDDVTFCHFPRCGALLMYNKPHEACGLGIALALVCSSNRDRIVTYDNLHSHTKALNVSLVVGQSLGTREAEQTTVQMTIFFRSELGKGRGMVCAKITCVCV